MWNECFFVNVASLRCSCRLNKRKCWEGKNDLCNFQRVSMNGLRHQLLFSVIKPREQRKEWRRLAERAVGTEKSEQRLTRNHLAQIYQSKRSRCASVKSEIFLLCLSSSDFYRCLAAVSSVFPAWRGPVFSWNGFNWYLLKGDIFYTFFLLKHWNCFLRFW